MMNVLKNPMRGLRVKKLAVALGVVAVVFFAQGSAMARDLNIAVQMVPENHDPVTENSNVNLRIMYSVYETLVKTDYRDGGNLKPGLATEWKVIDPKTVEFKLRPGVVFHNGDTFDAEDVVASFSPVRIGEDKDVPVIARPFLGGIERVEVVDKMTVRIHMKDDDAIALIRFANYPSQIISETALKEAKTYQEFTQMDSGSGPYSLVNHEIGKQVVLKRFDQYWGDVKAAADNVTFTQVPELSTRIAGLLAGQFDIITEVGTDEIAQIEANSNTTVVGGAIENIRGLFYDCVGSPLEDARVRQAMNLAIDRETLVKGLYADRVGVPNGWQLATFGAMYLKDRPIPEFNPEKAKELLKEAGYKGQEIVYRTQAGYYTKQGETAQVLQSMWKAVGLNVKVEVKENWAQVEGDGPDRAIIDASFTAYYPDPMGQFWRRFGPKSALTEKNYWTIEPEMLTLGNELATSIDTDRRRAVFAEMLDRFEKNPHGAILHELAAFMGVRKDRLELKPIPSEYLDLTTNGVIFK